MVNAREKDGEGKWPIRMLALSISVLYCLAAHPGFLQIFDDFTGLEEVVFVNDSTIYDPMIYDITNPYADYRFFCSMLDVFFDPGLNRISLLESELEFEVRERCMSDIAWLRSKDSRFNDLKITFIFVSNISEEFPPIRLIYELRHYLGRI